MFLVDDIFNPEPKVCQAVYEKIWLELLSPL